MELSGEAVSGQFFTGIPGLQFASQEAVRLLQSPQQERESIFWLSAADPASLCGVELESLGFLPARQCTSMLVFHGARLVMVARRGGAHLETLVPSDDPHLPEYLAVLREQLQRQFMPIRRLRVEQVNGEPAAKSRICCGSAGCRVRQRLWRPQSVQNFLSMWSVPPRPRSSSHGGTRSCHELPLLIRTEAGR